jgi:hypothetical protein
MGCFACLFTDHCCSARSNSTIHIVVPIGLHTPDGYKQIPFQDLPGIESDLPNRGILITTYCDKLQILYDLFQSQLSLV